MARFPKVPKISSTTALGLAVVLLATALLVALVPATLFLRNTESDTSSNAEAIAAVKRESTARRDQNCILFERQHKANVDRLKSTYDYLNRIPKDEIGSSLTQAVLRGLKAQEAEARNAIPPNYCNEKNVGLPEPPPDVPKKQDFSDLARPE